MTIIVDVMTIHEVKCKISNLVLLGASHFLSSKSTPVLQKKSKPSLQGICLLDIEIVSPFSMYTRFTFYIVIECVTLTSVIEAPVLRCTIFVRFNKNIHARCT